MKIAKSVNFDDVKLKDGFWLKRYELNKDVSIESVKQRFEDTGRFDALRFNHAETGKDVHIYYDSDVAKWIEAVAYLIERNPDYGKSYESFIDELIDCMEKNQRADGYLNSYFLQIEPDAVFTRRSDHELYCAGHLIEAAVAYHKATGKDKLLRMMEKYCDCIERAFITDKTAAFTTPGHEEIELALIKLYRHTGNKKYLEMSEFFLKNRGTGKDLLEQNDTEFTKQDDADVYGLREANGHSVRAFYLYSGIADLAAETDDEKLFSAVNAVFDDIVERKMYVTGGFGSTNASESFTVGYDLPNATAYSESCAAIGMMLFAERMRKLKRDVKFGHAVERVMYNTLLSSTDLKGKSFFYENPLEIALEDKDRQVAVIKRWREHLPITERLEVFSCSCCPPNINRIIASLGNGFVYVDGETVTVEQYVSADIKTPFGTVSIDEDYVLSGKASLSSEDFTGKLLAVRVPEWCTDFSAVLNGKAVVPKVKDGYAEFIVDKTFEIKLDFHIAPKFIAANPKVKANVGRITLTYGPLVYCLEGADNGNRLNRISVAPDAVKQAKVYKDFHGLYSIELDGFIDSEQKSLYFDAEKMCKTPKKLKFIPYFAFANRGESDMLVWVRSL